MSKNVLFIVFFLSIISCGKKKSDLLSVNEMKVVMWDVLNADSWYTQTAMRDTTGKLHKQNIVWYQQIFLQHDITKEQFYRSYHYFESNPDKMKVLMDSVEAYGLRTKMAIDYRPAKQKLHK